nr:hypothetical protein CFP56_44438 [Quercus suber]
MEKPHHYPDLQHFLMRCAGCSLFLAEVGTLQIQLLGRCSNSIVLLGTGDSSSADSYAALQSSSSLCSSIGLDDVNMVQGGIQCVAEADHSSQVQGSSEREAKLNSGRVANAPGPGPTGLGIAHTTYERLGVRL